MSKKATKQSRRTKARKERQRGGFLMQPVERFDLSVKPLLAGVTDPSILLAAAALSMKGLRR